MRNDSDTIGGWKTMGGSGDEETMGVSEALTISDAVTEGGDGQIVLAGRYRVMKRLGEGGMGSVWLAEDTKLDGRKVAIKMLPTILAGKKGAYKQVKAEALMAMKLSHSNIATVRAFEEDEGGNPFLVMDYIEGEGLDDILAERGPLSEEETVRLLGPVAAALDYAHAQGVVHRDVKPGNVMVRKDGTPFVLDFGIAREIQETMTQVTGKLSSGTLLYMSPEQLHGRAPKAVQDVYSFAAMAYQCLTGRPPFSRGQIEYQIDHDAPEELPEGVGEALRKCVMAGLAKDAGERPGSCAGVLGVESGGEGQWSKVEGQRSKVGGEDLATGDLRLGRGGRDGGKEGGEGNNENRFMDNKNRFADREKVVRELKDEGDGGEVFLTKVRLENELKMAGRGQLTEEERVALGKIREMLAAGVEALKAGRDRTAEGMFSATDKSFEEWKTSVEARREREREEERQRREKEEIERKRQEAIAARRKEIWGETNYWVSVVQDGNKQSSFAAFRIILFGIIVLIFTAIALFGGC